MSRVAASPATTASSTGRTRSMASGSPGPLADSLLPSTATARATRVSWAMTDQRRAATGRRTPLSWEASDSRTTRPTATQATAKAASSTSAAATQLAHGSGSGSPGTSQLRTSSTDSPMPNATPTGAAISRMKTGSARPRPHNRRAVTPRSEARASSGTRSSLAALSSRISSASATRTRERTAGAIELRAVDCWKRTSPDDVGERIGAVGAEGAARRPRARRRTAGSRPSSRPRRAAPGVRSERDVEVGVDPDGPLADGRDGLGGGDQWSGS